MTDSAAHARVTTAKRREPSNDKMFAIMLYNEGLHDVDLVGSDGVMVSANRCVLAAKSPVFDKMFTGKFKETSSRVVKIRQYKGAVLKVVVEYIYLNDIYSMWEANWGVETLVSLCGPAAYFDLPGLGEMAVARAVEVIKDKPWQSFAFMEACANAEDPAMVEDMKRECIHQIRSGKNFFKDNAVPGVLSNLSQPVLEELLEDDEIDEYRRFRILHAWSESPALEGDGVDRRSVASYLVARIPLDKINPSMLSTEVAFSGLLTVEQMAEVYKKQALKAEQEHGVSYKKSREHIPARIIQPPPPPKKERHPLRSVF